MDLELGVVGVGKKGVIGGDQNAACYRKSGIGIDSLSQRTSVHHPAAVLDPCGRLDGPSPPITQENTSIFVVFVPVCTLLDHVACILHMFRRLNLIQSWSDILREAVVEIPSIALS